MSGLAGVFDEEAHRRAAATVLRTVTEETPRTVEPLGRGNRKETRLLRFDAHDPVVLQVCDERTWLRTESVLLRQLRERTEVPVPPVLAADVTGDRAVVVTPYVPGQNLHGRFAGLDRGRQRSLARTFGACLGQLHRQFRFDGYGTLVATDGDLTAESGDWQEWLAEYGRTAVGRLPGEFDPVRDGLVALFDGHSPDETPPSRLFPWDFRPGNAVVSDGQLRAILDWEAPMAAAPALAAAKAEYLVADWYVDEPGPLRSSFVEGYETARPYPDVGPVHRAAAIADSAVDSTGTVTTPCYPELDRAGAVAFHRAALTDLL